MPPNVIRPLGVKTKFYAPDRHKLGETDRIELSAANGWVTVDLDAMPIFIVPA